MSEESQQQLTGRISIRNPSPVRTALGAERRKQPAIYCVLLSNNGASSDGKQVEKVNKAPKHWGEWKQSTDCRNTGQCHFNQLCNHQSPSSLPPLRLPHDIQPVSKHFPDHRLDLKPLWLQLISTNKRPGGGLSAWLCSALSTGSLYTAAFDSPCRNSTQGTHNLMAKVLSDHCSV